MKPEYELAKKLEGPSQMARVRAARAIIESARGQRQADNLALRGFMAIFHPDYPEDKLRELARKD